MSILISGPHQPINDIDVYLKPLMDDFKLLWSPGVEILDRIREKPSLYVACCFPPSMIFQHTVACPGRVKVKKITSIAWMTPGVCG
jgi:hypothetical protein